MGNIYLSSSNPSRPILVTPSASYLVGTRVSFLRIKPLLTEIDHSPPYSAEFKTRWSSTSAPSTCLQGEERDNFTFSYVSVTRSVFVLGLEAR